MTEEITPTTEVKSLDDILPKQVGQTYEKTALDWLNGLYATLKDVPEASHLFAEKHDENDNDVIEPSDAVTEAVVRFAHHLDSFATLDIHMELLAMRQIQKIDREFMQEMIDVLGLPEAKRIARMVNERHGSVAQQEENGTTQTLSA